MLKYILTTILIVSSLTSSVSSHATISESSSSNRPTTNLNKSPNRLIGEKDLSKASQKEISILNCQIIQNQSIQQIKGYQIITQNFLNDIQSGKVKINEKDSKLQQFLLNNSNKLKTEVKDHLAKIENHDCNRDLRFIRRHSIPQAKNLAYLRTISNQASKRSSAAKEVNNSFTIVNCEIDSDRMAARWNINGSRQLNTTKDWEEYLEKITKDNSKIIDRNKLESSKLDFKKAKESYLKSFEETKDSYLKKQCSSDQKENKNSNEITNNKVKISNKNFRELKNIFESIKI